MAGRSEAAVHQVAIIGAGQLGCGCPPGLARVDKSLAGNGNYRSGQGAFRITALLWLKSREVFERLGLD